MQRNYVTIRPLNREDSVLYFPPDAFGPFRVLHQIGAGTLGPVFRAYEPAGQRRDRLVAVKVFRLDLTPEQAAALVVELDALVSAGLNHPNIAGPIAAGLEQGAAYLAQEYAIGDSLDVVLRERGPMPMPDVVTLVERLAGAIDHAADRGVRHGLLHPRDILVADDAVRVTGFGIAAALSKIGAKLPTRTQYSSPPFALDDSIASAGRPGERDIYSLTAIAFEAATGTRLSADIAKEIEAEDGSKLRDVFAAALAADPEARPARASDFAAGLAGATGVTGSTGATGAKPAPIAPTAPVAPVAPIEDPLDRTIDLGARPELELDLDESPSSAPPFPPSRSAQPPRTMDAEAEPESSSRRWPIVAMSLAFAVLTALFVGFLLSSPEPVPAPETKPGVDSTIVDLPASAPSGSKPAAVAPKSASAPPASPERRRDKSIAPVAPIAPVASGRLLIRSTPGDADVFVDGKPRGKTPLALRELALGSYTIRVAHGGYEPEERTLRLTASEPSASATFNLRAFTTTSSNSGAGLPAKPIGGDSKASGLNVQSRPAGARVYVNDRLAGSTPISIPGLPAGPVTVRIELDGYRQWTTKVHVNAGEQTRVAASLERP